MSSVRQLFLEAVRQAVVTVNVTDGIKGHRSDSQFSSTKAPSMEQVKALLDSLQGDELREVRDNALISCLARLGLRREEAAKLRLSDIGKSQGYDIVTIHGKGSKDRRLKLSGPARDALSRLLVRLDLGDSMFQGIDSGRFTGRALTTNGIYHIVTTRMAAVGIEQCSPHSLRHFFITEARRQGCDLHKAQRAAGHADPRTTERYDHSWQDLDNSATDYIDF
jgi:site-specific recombinase XerD